MAVRDENVEWRMRNFIDLWGDLGVDGRTILEWTSKR